MNSPEIRSTVMSPDIADRAPAAGAITTARVIVARAAANYRHSPGLFAVTPAAPLGMMLLFGFVFGGAGLYGLDDAPEACEKQIAFLAEVKIEGPLTQICIVGDIADSDGLIPDIEKEVDSGVYEPLTRVACPIARRGRRNRSDCLPSNHRSPFQIAPVFTL